jgi:hypothetical protein
MADNLIQMQHASKSAASFTHGGISFDSDENGIINIPSHFTDYAQAHNFSLEIAEKPSPKTLAKGVKGVADETEDSDVEKEGKKAAKGVKGVA